MTQRGNLRSTSSSFRGSTIRAQRGYALISAIILAILYIALINLLLIDSTRELKEAQRFRAQIMAQTLAENAIELGAESLMTRYMSRDKKETAMGEASWRMERDPSNGTFDIRGEGTSKGVMNVKTVARIRGKITPTGDISIEEATYRAGAAAD